MATLDLEYFENILIQQLILNKQFAELVHDDLTVDQFNSAAYKRIIGLYKQYRKEFNKHPKPTELRAIADCPESVDAFKYTIKKINELDNEIDHDALLKNASRFIRERNLFNIMIKAAESYKDGGVDVTAMMGEIDKKCNVNFLTSKGIKLIADHEELLKKFTESEKMLSTGWSWLDDKLGGGFLEEGRSIYVFTGATNVGKSIFLGNVACNLAKQGKNVVLLSLEMSEVMYSKRLFGNLLSHKIDSLGLVSEHGTIKEKINNLPKMGEIIVKEFPPATFTVSSLRSYIRSLEDEDFKVDAIVLDYINLLRHTTGDNSYEKIKNTTEQVRALSYEFECPIISATQQNRSGIGQANPDFDTISESLGLAMTADCIFSIWREEGDEDINVLRVGIMKSRQGPVRVTTSFRVNYEFMQIFEDDDLQNELNNDDNSVLDALDSFSL